MSGIFICYRRDDSAPWAGRVYDSLVREWGEDLVFIDVDTIAPGEDFRTVISETVARSDVVLVVIGPDWVSAADATGSRRLEDEGDVHRTEVVSALASGARVIPVLVGGASMPKVADLPAPLKELAFRNAVVLEDRRFGSDVRALQKALARFAEEEGRAQAQADAASPAIGTEREPSGPGPPGPEGTPEPQPGTTTAPATPAHERVAPVDTEPPAPATKAPAPAAPGPGSRRGSPGTLLLVAVIACLVGGGYALVTSLDVAGYFSDPSPLVRIKDRGAGILPSVLGAAVLTAVAAFGFVTRWRRVLVAACLALTMPLGFLSFQQLSEAIYWCGYDCVAEAPLGNASKLNGVLLLAAAALCAFALWRTKVIQRSRWAHRPLERLVVVATAAWVVSLAIDIYRMDSESYGSAFTHQGPAATTWALLTALSIVGLTGVALRFLPPHPGMGALLGVALFPLLSIVTELGYLASDYETPTSSALLWLRMVPALATVVLVVVCTVHTRRTGAGAATPSAGQLP
jgi:TIR domain